MDDATRTQIIQSARDVVAKINDMGRDIAKATNQGQEAEETRKAFLKAIADQIAEVRACG